MGFQFLTTKRVQYLSCRCESCLMTTRIEENYQLRWIVARLLDALKDKGNLTESDIKNIVDAGKSA
jgi:hypothetical protein